MKYLITGSQGYIGSRLVQYLSDREIEVCGLDSGLYSDVWLERETKETQRTVKEDIRLISESNFAGIDVVIHLAALSNDPLGELNPELTWAINHVAAVNAARAAKSAGVSKFVFVSTQSIYGIANVAKLVNESDEGNPQTDYASSKWQAEREILALNDLNFTTISIRPSTIFGWSPRLRGDIVLNNFILNGKVQGKIQVLSDGTPWRPVLHIDDLCRLLLLVSNSEKTKVEGQIFNAGMQNGNYRVSDIAKVASEVLGGLSIELGSPSPADNRSYRVDFSKALEVLGFKHEVGLAEGAQHLSKMIDQSFLASSDYLGAPTIRIKKLRESIAEGKLTNELYDL